MKDHIGRGWHTQRPPLLCAAIDLDALRYSFKGQQLKQYADIYYVRLKSMQGTLVDSARAKWGQDIPLATRVLDLEEERSCVLVGTM